MMPKGWAQGEFLERHKASLCLLCSLKRPCEGAWCYWKRLGALAARRPWLGFVASQVMGQRDGATLGAHSPRPERLRGACIHWTRRWRCLPRCLRDTSRSGGALISATGERVFLVVGSSKVPVGLFVEWRCDLP
eukprot:Amastigsp_a177934_42.p2 type:complete len:134 gc:universal Amastigsp_a177934_42:517-116(-)